MCARVGGGGRGHGGETLIVLLSMLPISVWDNSINKFQPFTFACGQTGENIKLHFYINL